MLHTAGAFKRLAPRGECWAVAILKLPTNNQPRLLEIVRLRYSCWDILPQGLPRVISLNVSWLTTPSQLELPSSFQPLVAPAYCGALRSPSDLARSTSRNGIRT